MQVADAEEQVVSLFESGEDQAPKKETKNVEVQAPKEVTKTVDLVQAQKEETKNVDLPNK